MLLDLDKRKVENADIVDPIKFWDKKYYISDLDTLEREELEMLASHVLSELRDDPKDEDYNLWKKHIELEIYNRYMASKWIGEIESEADKEYQKQKAGLLQENK